MYFVVFMCFRFDLFELMYGYIISIYIYIHILSTFSLYYWVFINFIHLKMGQRQIRLNLHGHGGTPVSTDRGSAVLLKMAIEIVDFPKIFPLNMVISHSYVKLPEGNYGHVFFQKWVYGFVLHLSTLFTSLHFSEV